MKRFVHLVLTLALCLALSLSGALVRSSAVRAAGVGTPMAASTLPPSAITAPAIDRLTQATEYASTASGVLDSTSSADLPESSPTAAPSMTVTSPTNGATWYVGQTQSLTWTVSGDTSGIAYFELFYSVNGGSDWLLLDSVSAAPSTARSYSWTIPNTPSTQCRILAGGYDSSDNVVCATFGSGLFTISTRPSMTVTSPTNGATWYVGQTQSLTWTVSGNTSGIAFFILGYSVDGGSNYVDIDSIHTAPSTARSYSWTIPNTPSSQCVVFIVAVDWDYTFICGDYSSGLFAISAAPSMTVTSPTNGAVWHVGETHSITWTISGDTSGIAYFILGYSVDGGSNYVDIDSIHTASSTARSYSWTIPNTPSSQCRILVAAADSGNNFVCGAYSSGLFTISSAAYTLTTGVSPTAGGSIGRSPNAASYASGTVVTLTANANPGYHFVNWSGDLTGTTNPTTITMSTNRSVTAVFQADPLPDLIVDTLYFEPAQPTAGGSVTFNFTIRNQGLASVAADYAVYIYVDGVPVATGTTDTNRLASGASQGWYWDTTWPSDTASHTFMVVLDPTHVITESNEANNSASLSASAGSVTYTLTTTTSPTAGGSIVRSPNAASYAAGTVVTLTANANPGYTFTGWSGDLTGTTNPTTITMSTNRSVTAGFAATGTRSIKIIDATGLKLMDSTAGITQGYYNPNPTLTTEGIKFNLNDGDYVYNMGDFITGKLTIAGVDTIPTSPWKVSLMQFPNKIIDWTLVSAYLGTFTIGTANVHYDGPYFLRVESLATVPEFASFDVFNNILENDSIPNLYIKYNVAWVLNTITPGPQMQQISGYVTRGNGQTVDVPVFVGVTYPGVLLDGSLASYYSISPLSSGQFAMTFLGGVNPGLYRVFIMDGYYDTANDPAVVGTVMNYSHGIITVGTNPISNFVLDHDAMIYKTISNIPTAFALTTTASPSAGGSIGRSPNAASYASGTVVTLTANANPGYHFVNWSGDLTGNANPTTITMDWNKTVNATFAPGTSFSLPLLPSWNLVSVSTPLPVSSIPGLQAAYGYHDGWSVPTTLLIGGGYWVQVQNAVTVPLPGTPLTAPVSLPYLAGWQLLGNPFDVPVPISSITNHGLITTCYLYGASWGILNPATDSLQAGKGYWIYLSSPTTLTLTHP